MEEEKKGIDLRKTIARKCKNKDCNNLLSHWNRSGICSNCHNGNKWRQKYDLLKAELERKEELWRLISLDYYKKLKKYEPDITWAEELN